MFSPVNNEAQSSAIAPVGAHFREEYVPRAHGGVGYRPHPFSGTIPGYSTLAHALEYDEKRVLRRFAFFHSRVLSQAQAELRQRERIMVALAQEESIGMHSMRSGELHNRSVMFSILIKTFAEYSEFIFPAANLHMDASWRSPHPQPLTEWLCRGPNIRVLDQESHQRWQSYIADVKSVLLSPQDNDWLNHNIEDILDLGAQIVGDPLSHASWSRVTLDGDRQPAEIELGETAEEHDVPTPPKNWKSRARHARQYFFSKLYLPSSVLIYSINISTALAYFLLINTPDSERNASSNIYWKGSLIAWFITIKVLLVHGLFFGNYRMECYLRRLILVSIVLCGAIAFSLHALALNVISGVPAGVTSSVAFLQFWEHRPVPYSENEN